MDLFELIKVILGRWRVVVPIILLTLGLAYLVQVTTPPEYEASGFLLLQSPEFDAGRDANPVIDPAQIAQGIQLDGNFTVVPLGGSNYSVQASASSAEQAEEDVSAVVSTLAERITALQEQALVPANERAELRLVDPSIVAENQPDDSWLATATMFLNDPAQATSNPYLANSSTGRLLEVLFQGDAAQAEFAQRTNGEVTAMVGQQARDAAPLMQVVTAGSDPQTVIDGFYVVQEILGQDLQQRQERANVLPSAMLSLEVLDAPLGVTDESPPVQRATAGVIALGGLLALAASVGLEGLDRRRAQPGLSLLDTLGWASTTADVSGSRPDEEATPASSSRATDGPATPAGANGAPAQPSGPEAVPADATDAGRVDGDGDGDQSTTGLEHKLRTALATGSETTDSSTPTTPADARAGEGPEPTPPVPRRSESRAT